LVIRNKNNHDELYLAYNNRATKTIGGITVTTYTYDANNRLTSEVGVAGNTTYTYDDNGSQLTATIGTSTTTNTYDLFGQLKSYTGVDSVVTNYTYGPDGLRISKASGNTSTAYVWDGGNITNEFVSVKVGQNTTTTENKYVYGIGRIKATLGTAEVYYLYNAHGDVTGLTNASCDLTKSYVYDAFGVETTPDAADTNPFRYCGEYFDKETETYYLRARHYDPTTGRFTQEDPMKDGLNWYTYTANNPVSFIDPSGMVLVGAKEYAATYGPGCAVTLDRHTGIVTVSWQNKSFTFGILDSEYEDADWYIDDSLFIEAFGLGDVVCLVYVDSVTGNISIRVNFNISGPLADVNLLGATYRELFLEGIEMYWSGSFIGFDISTHAGESSKGIQVIIGEPDPKRPKVGPRVSHDATTPWSKSDPGIIHMESGQQDFSYTAIRYMWASAHEFGHILGVGDMYVNPCYAGHNNVMNIFMGKMESNVFELVIDADRTNRFQNWHYYLLYPFRKYWRTVE